MKPCVSFQHFLLFVFQHESESREMNLTLARFSKFYVDWKLELQSSFTNTEENVAKLLNHYETEEEPHETICKLQTTVENRCMSMVTFWNQKMMFVLVSTGHHIHHFETKKSAKQKPVSRSSCWFWSSVTKVPWATSWWSISRPWQR